MTTLSKLSSKIKRSTLSALTLGVIALTSLNSCSAEIWEGVAMGLAGIPTYSYSSYGSTTLASSYTTSSTSSSSSSSRKTTCKRCGGSGNCQTCGGSGRVYDYGNMSIVTKSKYNRSCGVCNGRGRCGVCDGKGGY